MCIGCDYAEMTDDPGYIECTARERIVRITRCRKCIDKGLNFVDGVPQNAPPFVLARYHACNACDNRGCMLKRMTPCQLAARLRRKRMICPDGRWASASSELTMR